MRRVLLVGWLGLLSGGVLSSCASKGQSCTLEVCAKGLFCLDGTCESQKTFADVGEPCADAGQCESGLCPMNADRFFGPDGTCTEPCATKSDCVPGWACTHNICTCTPSNEVCDGIDNDCDGIVDDNEADDDCATRHGAASVCQNASCVCTGTVCDGECIDTQILPTDCGSCGNMCPTPDAGNAACVHGECGSDVTLASGMVGPMVGNGTRVYWPESSDAGMSIVATDFESGTTSTVVAGIDAPDPQSETDGGPYWFDPPTGIPFSETIDSTHVYWTPGGAYIASAPLTGGAATTLVTSNSSIGALSVSGTNLLLLSDAVFDLADQFVFFGDAQCFENVERTSTTGGSPTTLFSDPNGVCALTSDESNVYWLEGSGAVATMPLTGGTPQTLAMAAPGFSTLALMAVDDTSVYWATGPSGQPRQSPSQIMKVSKSGGTPVALTESVSNAPLFTYVVLAAPDVYFGSYWPGTNISIRRTTTAGGTQQEIFAGTPWGMAIGPSGVMWEKEDATLHYLTPK